MPKILAAICLAVLLWASAARAQATSSASTGADSGAGPAAGGNEFEIWTGGGPRIHGGGPPSLGVWNVGVRYGWVLTEPHGPGVLRGRFEYAVDAVPIFWVFEPGGTAYGASFDPFALKWNFTTRGRIAPYSELAGGVLFTSRGVPPGTSAVNFTPTSAFGVHFFGHKYTWSGEIRFLHISDAGLTKYNPGVNTLELRVGFGFFTHPR